MTGAPPSLLMRKRAMLENLLACPTCLGRLRSKPDGYLCVRCQQWFPVRKSIPRFVGELSKGEQQVRTSFDLEHSRYQDSRHLHFTSELVQPWLQDIQLPAEWFRGKLILDAGCGSGRWTYAMAMLGATVVAVDFTDAGVAVTHEATMGLENVTVLQADVAHLPFRHDSFDCVVSWGVLHHTPDTKASFDRLVPLLKRGGTLYVMVYEKHNPWKFIWTDLLRGGLRLVSDRLRYRLCRFLIIKNRILFSFLRHRIICSAGSLNDDPLDLSTKQLGLYDAYSPLFNHLHTREEVRSWFDEHKFDQITLTKPVRFTQPQEVVLYGECGGSVNVRGVRG